MSPLPHAVTSHQTAHVMLETIIALTRDESPFMARVAQFARQASTRYELEVALVSLYRLGLEQSQPYVTDLTDELLHWLEAA